MGWIALEKLENNRLAMPSINFDSEFKAKRFALKAYRNPVLVRSEDLESGSHDMMIRVARANNAPVDVLSYNGKLVLAKII